MVQVARFFVLIVMFNTIACADSSTGNFPPQSFAIFLEAQHKASQQTVSHFTQVLHQLTAKLQINSQSEDVVLVNTLLTLGAETSRNAQRNLKALICSMISENTSRDIDNNHIVAVEIVKQLFLHQREIVVLIKAISDTQKRTESSFSKKSLLILLTLLPTIPIFVLLSNKITNLKDDLLRKLHNQIQNLKDDTSEQLQQSKTSSDKQLHEAMTECNSQFQKLSEKESSSKQKIESNLKHLAENLTDLDNQNSHLKADLLKKLNQHMQVIRADAKEQAQQSKRSSDKQLRKAVESLLQKRCLEQQSLRKQIEFLKQRNEKPRFDKLDTEVQSIHKGLKTLAQNTSKYFNQLRKEVLENSDIDSDSDSETAGSNLHVTSHVEDGAWHSSENAQHQAPISNESNCRSHDSSRYNS